MAAAVRARRVTFWATADSATPATVLAVPAAGSSANSPRKLIAVVQASIPSRHSKSSGDSRPSSTNCFSSEAETGPNC
ncbi:MAG: hypothetical protein HY288_11510 [Planctomycetia bacterium]|nr:hypothetical protein [Planctomycetia bacterium]